MLDLDPLIMSSFHPLPCRAWSYGKPFSSIYPIQPIGFAF